MLWATELTAVIRPPTVSPLGSCTLTGWPTTASLCLVASRLTVTTSLFEVVWRIGCAVAPLEPEVPEALAVLAPAAVVPVLATAPPPPERAPPPAELPPAAEPPAADRDEPPPAASSFFSSRISALSSASRIASDEGAFPDCFAPDPGRLP